ncbi:type II toxin-antitoxin system HicB family antitoxin [Puteibacter caeruleilacunae]|nr:type II toxin-antitoxin system HicB family antitoxin [Puteibacter caeruleilacunae]
MENMVPVILEKTDTGYSAYCDYLPGCVASGSSLKEVKQEFTAAVEFHLEGMREDGETIPPEFTNEYELNFEIDIEEFFNWFSGIITQSGLSKMAQVNKSLLSQYATGDKKPRKKQLDKIQRALHKFGEDLLEIRF